MHKTSCVANSSAVGHVHRQLQDRKTKGLGDSTKSLHKTSPHTVSPDSTPDFQVRKVAHWSWTLSSSSSRVQRAPIVGCFALCRRRHLVQDLEERANIIMMCTPPGYVCLLYSYFDYILHKSMPATIVDLETKTSWTLLDFATPRWTNAAVSVCVCKAEVLEISFGGSCFFNQAGESRIKRYHGAWTMPTKGFQLLRSISTRVEGCYDRGWTMVLSTASKCTNICWWTARHIGHVGRIGTKWESSSVQNK